MRRGSPTHDNPRHRQGLANQWGRESSRRAFFAQLRNSKDWRDIGALKRELLDYWVEERNQLFRDVVKDVEAQRSESQ